jgi:hypothetical protein
VCAVLLSRNFREFRAKAGRCARPHSVMREARSGTTSPAASSPAAPVLTRAMA